MCISCAVTELSENIADLKQNGRRLQGTLWLFLTKKNLHQTSTSIYWDAQAYT